MQATTKYPIGPEFIPDYRELYPNSSLTVLKGDTFTLPSGDVEFDAIHVEGTLKFSLTEPTTLKFVNLLVNGGAIWCGDDDTPQTQLVRMIKKDVPIDATFDPFQWGHGIIAINGGQRIMCGQPKDGWGTMQEALKDATSITLDWDAAGWEVGDELLLPDNRQMTPESLFVVGALPRRELPVTIATITGRTIGLSKGLDFEHLNAYDPDQVNFVPPCVANLTRKVNIESENPNGVRGHNVAAGMGASMDNMMPSTVNICHVTFKDCGRTRAELLDVTSPDLSHIGTNQIARYCDHDHHCNSSPMTSRLACVFINTGNAKWALSTHQTSDATIQDCVAVGFVGAAFVTEDGNEIRNVFEHNLACYCAGNGQNGKVNLDPPNNAPGAEGAGFWFHGPKNHVRNNRACCCATGFQSFYRNFPTGLKVSSHVGVAPDTDFDPRFELPLEFSGNVAASNVFNGFESWDQPAGWTATNLTSSNNGSTQVILGQGEPGEITINGCQLIAQNGAAFGVHSDAGYAANITLSNGFIAGCSSGVRSARNLMSLTNLVMQNVINVDESVLRSTNLLLDRVTHKPFGTRPQQYILHGWGDVWKVGDPFPTPTHGDGSYTYWEPNTGERGIIHSWQGDGKDYLLYETNSIRETAAWVSTEAFPGFAWLCPDAGLTMGQCWDKYGLAYGGGVVAQADAIQPDGLVNGVLKLWDGSVQAGAARCVLTYPGTAEEVAAGLSTVDLYFVLTGLPDDAGYRIQLDAFPPIEAVAAYGGGEQLIWANPSGAAASGQHTVQTWRLDPSGNVIPGSAMTFGYAVGEAPIPPIEPPPVQPPVEVWNPADVGPPFAGDNTLRVRAGVVQKLSTGT